MKSIYKIPGGKLIKINLEMTGDKIKSIQIFGDFFLHPEELIHHIEQSLIGVHIEKDSLSDLIKQVLIKSEGTLLGASPLDIAHAIHLALNSA
ncbi:MAG: lipoate protein ligase C-terminal domain-containing protein [Candidatus Thorarchaeota archaeon]